MKMITRVATLTAAAALAMAMMTGCSAADKETIETYKDAIATAYTSYVEAAAQDAEETATAKAAAAKVLGEHLSSNVVTKKGCEEVTEAKDAASGKKTIVKIICTEDHVDTTGDAGKNCDYYDGAKIGAGIQDLNESQVQALVVAAPAAGEKVTGYGVATAECNGVVYTAVAIELEVAD